VPCLCDFCMHRRGLWHPQQGTCGQVVRKWVWAVPCQATLVPHGHVGQQVSKELNSMDIFPILRNCSRKRRGEARGRGSWSGQCPASPSSHPKANGGLFPAQLSCSMLPVCQRRNGKCRLPGPSSRAQLHPTGIAVAKTRPSEIFFAC